MSIEENEAYINNNKKKVKLVFRKESNVCVLDLFVKVRSSSAAPIRYKPLEVDAINHVADGREQGKRLHIRLQQTNFLTATRVSVEDRSKRTETVRPQIGKHCESQSECDSGVSVKNDGK